jgi:uncharacterized protein (TIGR03066 family)
MRTIIHKPILLMLALLFVSQLSRAEPIKKPKEQTAEEKVIGKWNLVKSNGTEVSDTKIEFTKDGKVTITLGTGDDKIILDGKYKITKEGIDYEIDHELHKKKEVLKILKLDENSMSTEDPDGIKEEFERISEKKKDDEKKGEKKDDKK